VAANCAEGGRHEALPSRPRSTLLSGSLAKRSARALHPLHNPFIYTAVRKAVWEPGRAKFWLLDLRHSHDLGRSKLSGKNK